MIGALRSHLNSWVVRLLFLMLAFAFAVWGIGSDVLRRLGNNDTWVAKVGDITISPEQAQQAYQRQLAQVRQMFGGKFDPTPEMRRSIAAQSVDRLVAQALITDETRRLGIVTPDAAVREEVFGLPAFHGPNGQFDRARFEQLLRTNGLTEQRFLDLVRTDLSQRQLMEAVRAGAYAPDVLARAIYQQQNEKRTAKVAAFSFADQPAPADPGEDVLRRWWENHPDAYRTPEYRRVKVVVLSPQTLGKDIQVSDQEMHAAYEENKSSFATPARRSAEVISVADEAKAQSLAQQWRGGANWAAMQKAAQAAGGNAIDLTDASEPEYPSPELGKGVFAAAADTVTGPVHAALGWYLIDVTKVTPGTEHGFDEVKNALRQRIVADKAAGQIYDRANKVDNVLGTGATLDQLPGDLGLGAVTGTLDAEGNMPDGKPAPIPGPPELRAAVAAAAFQAQKGDPPHLTEVQTPSTGGSSYYALEVEDVTPAATKPFETVKDQVHSDWTRDAIHKEAEKAAADMLAAVKAGAPFDEAAGKARVTPDRTPPTTRSKPAEGFPPALVQPIFSVKQGEATMAETPDGFVVATPDSIETPDPKADPIGYDRLKTALAGQIADDMEVSFVRGLRERTRPEVNQKLFEQIAQP